MESALLIRLFVVVGVTLSVGLSGAGLSASSPTDEIWADPVIGKNFPLLALIAADAASGRLLADDPTLREALAERRAAVEQAAATCGTALGCHTDTFVWKAPEIARVGEALTRLASKDGAFRQLIQKRLRPSGLVERYAEMPDAELVGRIWHDSTAAMNTIISVYGLGEKPRYPVIDSVSYDIASDSYRRLVNTVTGVLHDRRDDWRLVYEPSLAFAVELMKINNRDEAGRHEPLQSGDNAAALQRVSSVQWQDYPYTVIVVPGAGSDRPDVALDPSGRMRVMLAAARFRAGQAPFLLVSGGYVHPNQTRFNEALEMKKALMREFGVPEHAIFVDPHARHTTTNLRNAARIMFRAGIPTDRRSLITTDQYQSEYIESPVFQERCDRELGYRPHELKRRVSTFDLEWIPRRESLHADPMDPLDPH